jgi:uncharacterized repeat protein (TIGR01451 family)
MSRANVKGTVMASVMNALMTSVKSTLTSSVLTSFILISAKTSPSRSNVVVRWLTTLLVLGAFSSVHAQDQTPQQAPFAISRRSTIQLDFRAGNLINCQLTDVLPGQTQLVRARLVALGDEVSPSELFETQLTAPLELTARDLVEDDDGNLLYTLAITNPSDETITRANLVDPLPTNTALQTLSVNCQASMAQPRALLITQLLPEGADYVAGSSQLDNVPQDDPYIANGRLYWLFPYQPEGQLGFALHHTDALADLDAATLTLRVGTRDVFVIGEQPSSNLPADLRAAVLTDMPVMDRVDVSDTGLTFVPLQLVADGRNPIELELQLSAEALADMQEETEAAVLLTVETGLEPLTPDADPLQSGYQLALDDAGRALLQLAPQTTVRDVRVQALLAGDVVEASFRLRGAERLLYQYQGTLTATLTGSTVLLEGVAQGYAELPLAAGTLQAALDVAADIDSDVDSEAESFSLDTERGLRDEFDPSDRFPLTGAANEASPTLRSDDGIALKYSQDGFSAGYYADSLSVPGVGGFQRATALRAETRGDVEVAGFAALLPESNIERDITPDGTRRYNLGEGVARGSEQLVLFTARGERPLIRNRDYSINYTSGVVTLAEPLWPFDRDFASQFLRVSYAPADATRDTLAYGVGGRYTSGPVSIGAGVAYIDELRFGADVRYRQPEFGLNARYTVDLIDDELENSRFTVNADGRLGDINASANLTYTDELDVQGRARAALEVTPGGSVALEHAGSLDTNRTSALYEQDLGALLGTELGTDRAEVVAGLGASYVWEAETVGALGRMRYSDEQTRLELTHTQTFDSDATSITSLLGRYLFDDNLSADGNLDYRWGNQLAGSVGLNQRLGDANLSLAYQLPGASGEGNRARFGVQAPFALTDSVSVDLNAGYDYDLDDDSSQAAVGLAARYSSPTLSATLGSEVAFPTEGDTKLTLRAGASGQLDDTQTLSADANYEVAPNVEGTFTLAYSLRLSQLTLLTYHRLTTEDDSNVLEGEFAPTYTPDLRWQLRPAFAYQLDFDDDDGSIYQITLGGLYYFDWLELFGNNEDLSAHGDTYGDNVYAYPLADDSYNPTIGVGAFAHYAWQSSGEDFIGVSVELGVQPLEPLWVSLGYTFNDFPGITATSRGGVYLRLDVTDARQE